MYKLIFTRKGIEVKKKVEKALTGGIDWITIESFNWRDFPKENIEIKVIGIDYELSSDNQENISKLEFTAKDIKRLETSNKIDSEKDFWEDIEEKLGIKREGEEIILNKNKSAKDNLVDFIKHMFEQGYISDKDIPISSGYKRYLLNREPKDKEGNKMKAPEKIAENVYLEAHWSSENIKKKIKQLGEEFGKKTE